jgi:hypothetical protein
VLLVTAERQLASIVSDYGMFWAQCMHASICADPTLSCIAAGVAVALSTRPTQHGIGFDQPWLCQLDELLMWCVAGCGVERIIQNKFGARDCH